ncbi:FAD-dependent monooxygenase [Chitinophagaceae bacterium LB-8]|uniref:FAD-dependent monooxygenase n=1 Tax=Paraflavisolibacter caeni TaxID=2982496 RepID=A0A9X3B874_9BACT|nr:FAD-dependent monooxygenase [Paraflavisolibacter caeni]MCU7549291.1 FAD-dependent monooxygenase [Paraflavisolibacter caeni]
MEPKNKNILISGAGIAGLTAAYWMKQYGFQPIVVEKAPKLREGGYMIDFWGEGFEVAEKMNIIAALKEKHYDIPEITFVNNKGKRVGGFNIQKLRALIQYRHLNMLRGELAKVLYHYVQNEIGFIFGNSITAIEQSTNEVAVTFKDGQQRNFDLVIGADGLHSAVRRLVFGAEMQYIKHLGYYVSSFTIDNYTGNPHIFQSITVRGKWAGIYSMAKNRLATFFIYKSNNTGDQHRNIEVQQDRLRETFKNVGWQCPVLLQKMPAAGDFYFDEVSQIVMPEWAKGRVALVGDASQCVSLIAGKGAALAMAGAYILAGELKKSAGDYVSAFHCYQKKIKPEAERMQKLGRDYAPSFVPDTAFGIWKRNTFTNLMFLPLVSKWFIKQFLSERLKLEEY